MGSILWETGNKEVDKMISILMIQMIIMVGTTMGQETERHVHPSLVTSCITEQLRSGLDNVKLCIKCFEAVGDPLSQDGLDKAKNCTDTWLPRASEECQLELNSTIPQDVESSGDVLACLTDVRFLIAAEECLDEVSDVKDVIEKLTDGILCLQENKNNLTNIIQFIFQEEIKEEFEQIHKFVEENPEASANEVEGSFEEQMLALVSQRHCNIASNTSEAEAACNQCFDAAAHPKGVPSPQEHVRTLAACSSKHLSPVYDSCSALLTELANNDDHGGMIGRELFRCFSRVVDKEEVITCSSELEDNLTDADDIDPWTLLDMMVCAEEINNQWVLDHVDMVTTTSMPVMDTTVSGDYV